MLLLLLLLLLLLVVVVMLLLLLVVLLLAVIVWWWVLRRHHVCCWAKARWPCIGEGVNVCRCGWRCECGCANKAFESSTTTTNLQPPARSHLEQLL